MRRATRSEGAPHQGFKLSQDAQAASWVPSDTLGQLQGCAVAGFTLRIRKQGPSAPFPLTGRPCKQLSCLSTVQRGSKALPLSSRSQGSLRALPGAPK